MPGLTAVTNPPPISGALNNCPVNVALPEVLLAIQYFANRDQGVEQDAIPALDNRAVAYEQLKRAFEVIYRFAPDSLSWKDFHTFLTIGLGDNSYAQQFVMGPVFRYFAAMNGAPQAMWDIQPDGRYSQLTMADACAYVHGRLGFSVTGNEKLAPADPDYQMHMHVVGADQVAEINTFNEGEGHWERRPAGGLEGVPNGRADLPEGLDGIVTEMTSAATRAGVISVATRSGGLQAWVKQQVGEARRLVAEGRAPAPRAHAAAQRQRAGLNSTGGPSQVQATLLQQSSRGFFRIPEADKIKPEDIDRAKAKAGESDADFAKRLQAAEIEIYKTFRR